MAWIYRKACKDKAWEALNEGKAKQTVGRRYSRHPTLDALAGASNTLNSFLAANHVQKGFKKL